MNWLKRLININISLKTKRNMGGYFFTLPFVIGFIIFFLSPFIQSFIFSLSEVHLGAEGYYLEFIGIENFKEVILINPDFNIIFTETVLQTFIDIPLILSFSFFASLLLNQKYRGRTVARAIFFLPVILSAGIVLRLEQQDYVTSILSTSTPEAAGMFSTAMLQEFFLDLRLPESFLEFILHSIDYLPEIIRSSGIQIFIFLAGLQSIHNSLYEAADVEGATGWENFWLITLPLMSPIILVNIIFTIVASFTAADNELLELIRTTSFAGGGYGVGTAMSWIYLLSIGILLMIILKIVSSWVFYQE